MPGQTFPVGDGFTVQDHAPIFRASGLWDKTGGIYPVPYFAG
jgi:hypothetical protein